MNIALVIVGKSKLPIYLNSLQISVKSFLIFEECFKCVAAPIVRNCIFRIEPNGLVIGIQCLNIMSKLIQGISPAGVRLRKDRIEQDGLLVGGESFGIAFCLQVGLPIRKPFL